MGRCPHLGRYWLGPLWIGTVGLLVLAGCRLPDRAPGKAAAPIPLPPPVSPIVSPARPTPAKSASPTLAAPPSPAPRPRAAGAAPCPNRLLDGPLRAADSVVQIEAETPGGIGRGTAFAIGRRADATVLATSAHVVHDATRVRVQIEAATWRDAEVLADLLDTNPGADLALLTLPADLPRLDTAAPAGPGEQIWALGFGPGRLRVVPGRLAAIQRDRWGQARLLELSAALQPGDSGGPVLDRCGRAIGVNVATGADVVSSGTSYAVTWSGAREVLAPFLPWPDAGG